MAHAHPLPDGHDSTPCQSSRSSYISPTKTPAAPNTLISPRPYEILNQQTRLLQLRNAGFRGSLIPGRRISPVFGSPSHAVEALIRPINDENSSATSERRKLYGEDLPPSPVNILQEIHNSTRRKRLSPRPGFRAIFQDPTETRPTGAEGGTSWYDERSNSCSPPPSRMSAKRLKLGEGSGNERTPPPLNSPLTKQLKGQKMNRANLRSSSFEASKYIEHLEAQLTAVSAKLDSLISPTSYKARSAKVRALTAESRTLRQEVMDWEKNFAHRVKEEIDQRTELETGMRLRLQTLQDEVEIKDVRIRELEWEVENIRTRIKETEGLEEVNMNLEKRIDVLTSLLVVMPSKLDLGSATSSPSKADPLKRRTRPRSMLPRPPSSPGGARLSLNTNTEALFWNSRRYESTSSISDSPGGTTGQLIAEDEREASEFLAEATRLGSSSRASASFRSVPSLSTRHTSIQSDSCLGLRSPGEFPMHENSESQTKSAFRQRKMRRFPSGSCTLKPLILPKAAVTPSLPASAPVIPCYSDLQQRDISGNSLDPTTAFLSRNDYSSPLSTPTLPTRQRSATSTQQQTLEALEGKLQEFSRFREATMIHDPTLPQETPLDIYHNRISEQSEQRRARPLSLEKELELVNTLSPNPFEDGLIPATEVEMDFEATPSDSDLDREVTALPNTSLHAQNLTAEIDITPKPNKKHNDRASPYEPVPPTAIATRSSLGIFTRLTDLISRSKQDPVVLAQRLLYNAWTLGSSRWGGMGWWLLGLVLGSYGQTRVCAADGATVEDKPSSTFNWQHFSASASRARTAESYFYDQAREVYPNGCDLSHRQPFSTIRASDSGRKLDVSVARPPEGRKEPHLFPCDDCVEPSSRRTFRLWFHFSLAIVLAVGVAIKHGPGSLLVDTTSPPIHVSHHQKSESQHRQNPLRVKSANSKARNYGQCDEGSSHTSTMNYNPPFNHDIVFAEILGPSDFECFD